MSAVVFLILLFGLGFVVGLYFTSVAIDAATPESSGVDFEKRNG